MLDAAPRHGLNWDNVIIESYSTCDVAPVVTRTAVFEEQVDHGLAEADQQLRSAIQLNRTKPALCRDVARPVAHNQIGVRARLAATEERRAVRLNIACAGMGQEYPRGRGRLNAMSDGV